MLHRLPTNVLSILDDSAYHLTENKIYNEIIVNIPIIIQEA